MVQRVRRGAHDAAGPFARRRVDGHVGDRVRQFHRGANVAAHLEAPARETVNGEADLRYVRVAAIAGTETTEYLGRERIAHQVFADAEAGLSALQKGRIDALVYDRSLLLWLVNERFSGSLQVLDATFDPQVYAIALQRAASYGWQSTSPCSTPFRVTGGGRRCSRILGVAEVSIASPFPKPEKA